ncbi:hypothetical protein ATK30_0337 [Amycolatopsis echigonensis]|uniref:Type III secretion system (T3SS) SseB-like protein n=1 Tax=Amycolatopsis echigonensis TaxID=2576905 RepID=A0A2N3X299_9PSEU|nr:type VII secretion system-associated protein [Amycolatopsis niigatensis]PKW00242.1 hypothetical protein ATK30_0337 [Amycolatopsis niigatensis]
MTSAARPDLSSVMTMIDPSWEPSEDGELPPLEAVVGGWFVDRHGDVERFEPNPAYQPSRPGSPTDPVDAAVGLVVHGKLDAGELVAVMRHAVFAVAVDENRDAVVAPAPDGVPSLLVATAPAHQQRVDVAGWIGLTFDHLAAILPAEDVDVLLNPGAPASVRVDAGALKQAR